MPHKMIDFTKRWMLMLRTRKDGLKLLQRYATQMLDDVPEFMRYMGSKSYEIWSCLNDTFGLRQFINSKEGMFRGISLEVLKAQKRRTNGFARLPTDLIRNILKYIQPTEEDIQKDFYFW